jgi:hypothetical protein
VTFRNSIGDLTAPKFRNWCDESGCNKTGVYIIQTIFFVQAIYMVIVLLNFLIAIISQSYEKVMNFNTMYMYQNKVELNKEYLMIVRKMPWVKMEDINLLVMFSPISSELGINNEWLGFVQTLKTFIVK